MGTINTISENIKNGGSYVRYERMDFSKTTFGGYVNESEFETDYRGKDQIRSYWAEKIASDFKFDKSCEIKRHWKFKCKNLWN